jgi:hypothetical protein
VAAPRWLENDQQREYWRKPWTVPTDTRKATRFKKLLREHGYLSPHFKIREARCHDAAETPVPARLLPRAQRHAFNLERLRHELGDVPLSPLSWYRTPAHNAAVGGASESRHMKADGTDFDVAVVNAIGTAKFDRAAEKVFDQGGFGRYPSGSRHVDSRGTRARW